MTTTRVKRHIAQTWVFRFGGAELRIEETPRESITLEQAQAIAFTIRDEQGWLCVDCHKPARFRIVHVNDPLKPRCWDCNESATQSYGQRE